MQDSETGQRLLLPGPGYDGKRRRDRLGSLARPGGARSDVPLATGMIAFMITSSGVSQTDDGSNEYSSDRLAMPVTGCLNPETEGDAYS